MVCKTILSQYGGCKEIGNYRGNSVIADNLAHLRRNVTKKHKVKVTLRFKDISVTDFKQKVIAAG